MEPNCTINIKKKSGNFRSIRNIAACNNPDCKHRVNHLKSMTFNDLYDVIVPAFDPNYDVNVM